jgi:hypothetical protein
MMTNYQIKAQGTNLVPNPSFELYDSINGLPRTTTYVAFPPTPHNPQGQHWIVRLNVSPFSPTYFTDPVHVNNWFRANQGTADYYHRDAQVPKDRFVADFAANNYSPLIHTQHTAPLAREQVARIYSITF